MIDPDGMLCSGDAYLSASVGLMAGRVQPTMLQSSRFGVRARHAPTAPAASPPGRRPRGHPNCRVALLSELGL